MRRLFIGNFNFEHQLAGLGGTPGKSLLRLCAELPTAWTAVAADGDLVWTPQPIDAHFFASLAAAGLPCVQAVSDLQAVSEEVEVVPWGWTVVLRRFAGSRLRSIDFPADPVVREVNSREFSFSREEEWGVGLPGTVRIESVDQLASTLSRLNSPRERWVVKAEFSMAGRERLLRRGQSLAEQDANWISRRLRTGGAVYFEPWVEITHEAGLQFTVARRRPPRLEAVTPLLPSSTGVYRGSRFEDDASFQKTWSHAVEIGLRTADLCRRKGYFGPLGIDAARYRISGGDEHIRPLQDVNARQTMGGLSLGLRRLLAPGESGAWHHLPVAVGSPEQTQRTWDELAAGQKPGSRIIRTSPDRIGGREVSHGTAIVISKHMAGNAANIGKNETLAAASVTKST